MGVKTKGIFLQVLDDLTNQYEESLVAFCFEQLDYHNEDLSMNFKDKTLKIQVFQEEEAFLEVCEMIRKCEMLQFRPKRSYMYVSFALNARYFNFRSYGEEMLIE